MTVPPSVIVPLVVAFTDDTSSLSEVRVARVVRFHKEHGASGFLVNGATGDYSLLSNSERKQLVEWVVRDAHGLPVWVNATATTTTGAIDLCQHAARHGARGAVVCVPPIGTFYEHEIAGFLRAIKRHGNIHTVFADPDGEWGNVPVGDGTALELAESVAQSEFSEWAQFERACPDEMNVVDGLVTPMALFGADKLEQMSHNMPAFRPAARSLIGHGGLSRGARCALEMSGVDVGTSRSPVFELSDDGKKILEGMSSVLDIGVTQ